MTEPRIALYPDAVPVLAQAIVDGGGRIVGLDQAEALVWTGERAADRLRATLDQYPTLRWVQLPRAGVDRYLHVLDHDRVWTSGKGAYAEPCAEHALALALGGMRGIGRYARAAGWSEPYGVNLLDARVAILGGGAIARSLLRLLQPFRTTTVVVRNRPEPVEGADEVMGADRVHEALAGADLVVLALALTPRTERIIDAAALDVMQHHAWLVNVARGRHVDTDALVAALAAGRIGGAGLDVTDPEPLPTTHPLWTLPNAIVTPHIANTPEMNRALLAVRTRENVERFGRGEHLLGEVSVDLGY